MSKVQFIKVDGVETPCVDCPACEFPHQFEPGRWTFNGDLDKPTFSPSMLVQAPYMRIKGVERKPYRCHSFVRDGKIQFLGDCLHGMAGQTVDLPEIEI